MKDEIIESDTPDLGAIRRIVIKVGTRVISRADGRLAQSRLLAIVEAAVALKQDGPRARDVLLVSSGAVGLGRGALGLEETPAELAPRQACAAVGQGLLMGLYEAGFGRLGTTCGQVLLTEGDFDDRGRYLKTRAMLGALLAHGAVPVINEDDAVTAEKLGAVAENDRPVFSENDRLAALIASKLDADLLVLLTHVDGLYDRDPRLFADASLVYRVDSAAQERELLAAADGTPGDGGRGGMRSKAEAASLAARSGCHALIASGHDPGAIERFLEGEAVGTWFPARGRLAARRRWIAFAAAPRGIVHLDAGAVAALRERARSLLPVGVREVEGDFSAGDIVELRGPGGALVGRGIIGHDAETTRLWCRGRPPAELRSGHALIRRDDLVLEES